MAAGDGVRRFVRLVLDKTGVKKFQSESQRAIERGTDPKKAEKNLGRIDRGFARLKKAALSLGAALGAAFVARKIAQFGKEAIRVATEAGAVWNRLAGQLRNAGVEFRNVEGQINAQARAMQDATTVGDEDFAAVLTELVGTTGDYEASLREVQTVADLAAAKNIDLKTAAQLVGRAMVGQTGSLSRYGIVVGEGADAMEVLRSRFAGMAENEAQTLAGRLEQLNNEWSDFKQAVGDAMIVAGGGTSVLETLTGTVRGMTTWVNENRTELAKWGSLLILVTKNGVENVALVFRAVFNVGQALVDVGRLTVATLGKLVTESVNKIAGGANFLLEQLDKLPGVDIDFRFGGLPVESFDREISGRLDSLKGNLGDLGDSVAGVAENWMEVWRAATSAAEAQEDAVRAGAGAGGGAGGAGGGGGGGAGVAAPPSVSPRDVAVPRQPIPGVPTPVPVEALSARPLDEQKVQEILAQMRTIQNASQSAAAGVQLAWERAFGEMFNGFANVQAAAVALARGLAGALIGGVADYAGAKVAENVALAVEETARGLAALANPFKAWEAPIHFAAAKAHALSAAKWAALAGGAGAAGSALSGGGGGSRVGAGGTNRLAPGFEGERQGPEVHIYLDPFDPDSPLHQRQVGRAMGLARERFGDQVPVKIHRGSSGRSTDL